MWRETEGEQVRGERGDIQRGREKEFVIYLVNTVSIHGL
jgi:hypothetical protein